MVNIEKWPVIGGVDSQNTVIAECHNCGQQPHSSIFELVGSHACNKLECEKCHTVQFTDLPYGHSLFFPFAIGGSDFKLFGGSLARDWYGLPFQEAVQHPQSAMPSLEIIQHEDYSGAVVFLPCIDYLYGHSLLKLLQAKEHLDASHKLIVLVPRFLAWMVPRGVVQTWIVDLPLKKGRMWYPALSEKIRLCFANFHQVRLSPAHPHPSVGNPVTFTQVPPWEDIVTPKNRVSFIWRDDRLWGFDSKFLQKTPGSKHLERWMQKKRIIKTFEAIRKASKIEFTPTVIGIGKSPCLPDWIDNHIIKPPLTSTLEKSMCHIYSESVAVVGIHGSNMLLPSWHARSTFDLMPSDRWGNFAQDILYHDSDPRTAAVRHRYLSMSTRLSVIASEISSVLNSHEEIFGHYARIPLTTSSSNLG